MVAVKLRSIALFGALMIVCGSVRGEVQPRFEGLRSDSLYMALLQRESTLGDEEEEMMDEVERERKELKAGDVSARRSLESKEFDLFDLQRERGEVLAQVRDIEQRWELENIEISQTGVAESSSMSGGVKIEGESVATVAQSRVVKEMLSEGDYELLERAQSREGVAKELHSEFMLDYQRMRELQQLYAQSESEEEATKLLDEFEAMEPVADSLLFELDGVWSPLYADKVFVFNLILEVLDREDILLQGESILREGAALAVEAEDYWACDAVVYDAQKRALLGYEMLIAEVLKLERAAGALKSQLSLLSAEGEVEMLSDVEIKERNFIEYDGIKFSSTAIYSKSKPIPEAKLYEKGTIYRIQLGAYKTPQVPSIFRGAYPLSYDRALGFWTCYTGAYATMVEAQKAQALCKKRGFNRPEIVAWRDGVRRNVNRQPFPATKGYRVSIETSESLSESVEAIINRVCGDVEITRVGADRYIVGDMSHIYIAEDLVEALAFEDEALRLSINEIE